jgi:hypothetical protein
LDPSGLSRWSTFLYIPHAVRVANINIKATFRGVLNLRLFIISLNILYIAAIIVLSLFI